LVEQTAQAARERVESMEDVVRRHDIKAFTSVTVAESLRAGVRSLLLSSGLGSMRPNTVRSVEPSPRARSLTRALQVVLSLDAERADPEADRQAFSGPGSEHHAAEEIVDVMSDCALYGRSVILTRKCARVTPSARRVC
jgi:hypothetical protein